MKLNITFTTYGDGLGWKKNIGYVILPFDVFQFGPIEVNLLELFYAMLLTSSMIMNDWGKVYERRM